MAGQIVKAKFEDPFARIPNEFLQNNGISARAKGVLSYILSLPSDWVIYKTHLHQNFTEGRDAITNAFNELVKLGYIVQVQKVDPKTMRFNGYDYIVYSYPFTENPKTENPKTENQVLPKKLDTNKQNTNNPLTPLKGGRVEIDKEDEINLKTDYWIKEFIRLWADVGYKQIESNKIDRKYIMRKMRTLENDGINPRDTINAMYGIFSNEYERKNNYPSATVRKLFNKDTLLRFCHKKTIPRH